MSNTATVEVEALTSAAAAATPRALGRARFSLLALAFMLSGAAGLASQLSFSKFLSYVVGSTAYAVSAVLAAFMAGITIGAAVGGRLAHWVRRPFVAYAVAEAIAALAIAVSPGLFHSITPLYVSVAQDSAGSLLWLSVLRWIFACTVVLIPTIAMGSTLPLIAAATSNTSSARSQLSLLYACNTLGGALGALLAAYVFLPLLGLSGCLWLAAALGLCAGALALFAGASKRRGTTSRADVALVDITTAEAALPVQASQGGGPLRSAGAFSTRTLIALGFSSGALVFTVEVVATHLLAVVIGNSAYAFGVILAVFLSCLFLGAQAAPGFKSRFQDRALGLSLALTGIVLLLTIPLWEVLPLLFAGLGEVVTSFGGREATRALVALVILSPPVSLMGLTFPLLLEAVARDRFVGKRVGQITAWNTLGAVFGALLTGYVLLPALGSQRSLELVAAVFCVLGFFLTRRFEIANTSPARGWFRGQRLAAIGLLLLLLLPRWDLGKLTLGTNVYFDHQAPVANVLFAQEDVHGGITTVTRSPEGVHTLYTNGKFQGNDGWELAAQRFFSHYPALFVEDFERALIIGLGTGTTLGTYAAYPWQKIDVAEISPAIVAAADKFFSGPNRNALKDPRVSMHIDDGRNFLLVSKQRYNLIGMELTSVWFAGAASLYSREFYSVVKDHLQPRGIFQQWVQLHHISPPTFATLVNTLRQQFRHVALFYGGGQGILVASDAPFTIDHERLSSLEARPGFREVLPNERRLADLTEDVLLHDEDLDRFLAAAAEEGGWALEAMISSDENVFLEYATPRGNVLPWSSRDALIARLRSFSTRPFFPDQG